MVARPRIERVLPAKAARSAPESALDLAILDPAVWHVLSAGKAHGPFTLGQLQAFADAGRINPVTRISSGDGAPFLPALDHAPLRPRIEAYLQSRAARRAEASNYVIVTNSSEGADASAAAGRRHVISAALNLLGRFSEPMPGTYILRSARPLGDIRRALEAAAPGGAQFLIVESRDARLGWSGLPAQGSEAILAVWDAPLPQAD